jgi:hypothetical protein
VLADRQLRFVVEDLVEDVGGVAHRRGDYFRAELRVLIRGPCVEGNTAAVSEVAREGLGAKAPSR